MKNYPYEVCHIISHFSDNTITFKTRSKGQARTLYTYFAQKEIVVKKNY